MPDLNDDDNFWYKDNDDILHTLSLKYIQEASFSVSARRTASCSSERSKISKIFRIISYSFNSLNLKTVQDPIFTVHLGYFTKCITDTSPRTYQILDNCQLTRHISQK